MPLPGFGFRRAPLVEELPTEGIILPKTCNQSQARMLEAQKVMLHKSLLDEITRRDVIKFVEEEDDVMDCSNDDALVTSDKESDLDNFVNIVDDNKYKI